MPRAAHVPDHAAVPVQMCNGMGVDSAALLTRWLLEPASRDFDLADLTVVTAMTGDEFARTERAMREHLLPLLAAHRVRYVQIARAGQSDEAGYVVLDDSTEPTDMHMRGPWRLSDELRRAGTVPQVATGRRLCSYRAKGQVLDWFAAAEYGDRPRRHVIGFAAEEITRAQRDSSYTSTARDPWYPLIEWGWDRERCARYLRDVYGVDWPRSCCGYCPFQAGKDVDQLVQRWYEDPAAAAQALVLEYVALALNPRMALFGTKTARAVADRYLLGEGVRRADRLLSASEWAVYEVRRVFRRGGDTADRLGPDPQHKGHVWRYVRTVERGSQGDMRSLIDAAREGELEEDGEIRRRWVRRAAPPYPSTERFLVAAPAGVEDKHRPNFAAVWHQALAFQAAAP